MKLLAVDDDQIFLELLRATLDEIGYEDVTYVQSAAEALAAMRAAPHPYDCLLLDILMPQMNGIELARTIRTNPVYRTAPILMITAANERHFVDEAFVAGATDYINKPLDVSEIRARLKSTESMVAQSRQLTELSRTVEDYNTLRVPGFSFTEPVYLDDVGGLVGFVALENYLLKLGKMGMFSNSVLGFHVINASGLYTSLNQQDYIDLMSDVADTIWGSIRATRVMFAYAGSGDFVCILHKVPAIDVEALQDEIDTQVFVSARHWIESGITAPKIAVGHTVNHSLLSLLRPSDGIEKAIGSARTRAADIETTMQLPKAS